jgi:hypothetical protein
MEPDCPRRPALLEVLGDGRRDAALEAASPVDILSAKKSLLEAPILSDMISWRLEYKQTSEVSFSQVLYLSRKFCTWV